MPMYDYQCEQGHKWAAVVPYDDRDDLAHVLCPECDDGDSAVKRFFPTPHQFKKIVPDYPGSKKRKAGYQHTHGDKPREKSSNFGKVR